MTEVNDQSNKAINWPWDWDKNQERSEEQLKKIVENFPSYAYDAVYRKPEEVGMSDSLYCGFQVYCFIVKEYFTKTATEASVSLKSKLSKIAEEAYQIIDLLLKWVEIRVNVNYHTGPIPIDYSCSRVELVSQWDTILRKFKLCMNQAENPAETEQKGAINVNISGDVKAENLQIGHDASIHKQAGTEQNKSPTKCRGIWIWLNKIPRWIYGLVVFLAALLTCIGYLLGWLGPIKAFMYKIVMCR